MITGPGDVVLVLHKDKPLSYARVEEITADVKPGWWRIRLLFLQVPTQEVTWILREEYIDGGQFTMGGEPMNIKRLPPPAPSQPPAPPEAPKPEGTGEGGKVLNLASRRPKA